VERFAGICLVSLAWLLLPNPAGAAPGFTLLAIADEDTPVPFGSGTFVDFGLPVTAAGTVVFIGEQEGFVDGVYAAAGTGPLEVIADENSPVPGSELTFTGFEDIAIGRDGSLVINAQAGSRRGIYRWRDGSLARIVDDSDPAPGATGTFSNFYDIAYDGDAVVFTALARNGDDAFWEGIYVSDGREVRLLADENTAIPEGQGVFDDFGFNSSSGGQPAISEGRIVFTASGEQSQSGIYADFGDGLFKVVDQQDLRAGRDFAYAAFDSYSVNRAVIRGETILFSNNEFGVYGGVYVWSAGIVRRLVDTGFPLPGRFEEFSTPAVSGRRFAFGASATESCGIGCSRLVRDLLLTNVEGRIAPVVRRGDAVDGKSVSAVTQSNQSVGDGRYTALLTFGDGSVGVYLAVPVQEAVAQAVGPAPTAGPAAFDSAGGPSRLP
jgi:hypothetical protein